ncbi:MAG: bifunctional folylpolyglutamate synthase/dihydrofolate synthase [Flavobacteriales bacterium]|nr:bifunctional folylpolyglutamate synthase/dihydrofolate synthase [Flavobacteriales bacterium]
MNYSETLDWMFNQLPFYQKQGAVAFKPGLEKIAAFCEVLGNPQDELTIVHIGGTNGKGSTAHLMASVLQENGFQVGIYSSPHLLDFRERIKINGCYIEKKEVVAFIATHKDYITLHELTFFEISFALAVTYFAAQKIDYALIEVGMGGRLDATNIVKPILSVITNIGLDHTQFLGSTHTAIAGEKAGIIKRNIPVVIGEEDPDTRLVFETHAKKKNAPIHFAAAVTQKMDESVLNDFGSYQTQNIQTAYTALQQLLKGALQLDTIYKGFAMVTHNTALRGRWEKIASHPTVILDVSHNQEGFSYFNKSLAKESYDQLHLVLGFVKDKNIGEIFKWLPKTAHYYFCAPDLFRALPIQDLEKQLPNDLNTYQCFDSVENAYFEALAQAHRTDLVVVTGSTFVVAEALEKIQVE